MDDERKAKLELGIIAFVMVVPAGYWIVKTLLSLIGS
jgi:hypothetical protein